MRNLQIYGIAEHLPHEIKSALLKMPEDTLGRVAEIRLRAGNVSTVTVEGDNKFLTTEGISDSPVRCIRTGKSDIEKFIYKICGGSVYAYEESIKNGYIPYGPFRIGICGSALQNGGGISGFSEITSVNIRIPNHVFNCSDVIISHISQHGFEGFAGILVCSPPGVGKTTTLRDAAIKLSRGIYLRSYGRDKVYRVAVIDERCEIYIKDYFKTCAVDVISGCSKRDALERVSRTMAPEIIICDEIGSSSEAEMILNANIGGIVTIASVHGDSVENVLSKAAIRKLCENRVFSHIYVMKRQNGKVTGKLYKCSDYLN